MALKDIKVVIPEAIKREYNDSLTVMPPGKNTLIGNEEQLRDLEASLYNPDPIVMLKAREGAGKTALVEQFIYNRANTDVPVIVIQLNLEKLGELGSDVVVSRIRTLLTNMRKIETATQAANPTQAFDMALFIDEIHKLNNYGVANKGNQGCSGAMNALKEETSRGKFPLIGATTLYEYDNNIKKDPAFARRFSVITVQEPDAKANVAILQRRLASEREQGRFTPELADSDAHDIVNYANSYIYNQANPAKCLYILNKCIGLCRYNHVNDAMQGMWITHDVIKAAFLSMNIDIDAQKDGIKLVIPPQIQEAYNHSLIQLPMGNNSLIGYKNQLEQLDAAMLNVENQTALLLGEPGIGKTALVEQWIYNRAQTSRKVAVVSLEIEKLGELPENVMIARLRSLLTDLNRVKQATLEGNPHLQFDMVLFVDEIHKLNAYGATSNNEGSSAAMNALKEGLARGAFAMIGATTDYEYRQNIVQDQAFDRRMGKVAMEQPTLEQVEVIIKRRLQIDNSMLPFDIVISERNLKDLIGYADSFIRNQANPAKTLAIFDKCTGFCRQKFLYGNGNEGNEEITHEIIRKAFDSEGYAIDATTTPQHVEDVVKSQVIGQPLARHELAEVVKTSLYMKRNFDRPLMTAFFVGSTGVGKTQTAKALAQAFFGRRDAMVMINCGDYATKESAIEAQHYIGDHVQINKRQLILLDEIEKADIAVMDTFMRMIDDGIARDSHNIDRSLNSTIIVATSNLGANIFAQLADNMHLSRQQDPDVLKSTLIEEWMSREQTVRHALQSGDEGLNNGIKPEFLERFSLFVPFLPLARKTIAMIARAQLEYFVKQMKDNGRFSINIQLPAKQSHAYWQQLMGEYTEYGDDDPVSVMIAQDVIGPNAKDNGARSITRYIDQHVKTAVVDVLDERVRHNLPIDGAFRLEAKNASFESNNRKMAGVKVVYIPIENL